MSITALQIKALAPKDSPYKVAIADGLYLFVSTAGGKLWRYDCRIDGKRRTISIGRFPELGIKEAKARLAELKRQIKTGTDPVRERKQAKKQAVAQLAYADNTFEKITRQWLDKMALSWSQGHLVRNVQRLECHALPQIGARPIGDLTRKDLAPILDQIESTGAIETARRVAYLLAQIFRYALDCGLISQNPAEGLSRTVAKIRPEPRAAILDAPQFGKLLLAIDSYKGQPATRYCLLILAHTLLRSNEARGADWREIDFKAATWTIPAGRMKTRKEHIVPLSSQVLTMFQELYAINPPASLPITLLGQEERGGLIFPGLVSRRKPITDESILNAIRRLGYGRDEMSVHGFRAAGSTLLHQLGKRHDLIEEALAHQWQSQVAGAYNRYGYLAERRQLMQEWSDYLDKITGEANV